MKAYSAKGISVVICCYNSANRLGNTLTALAAQQTSAQLQWEVVIVDNASTDNTGIVALEFWHTLDTVVPLRVVYESNPGLGNARRTGIKDSRYSLILFCDDDNWLEPDYLQGVVDILESDDNIAACGGMGIPIFETEEPYWFYKYAEAFALGSQELNVENGRLLNLYGAGLAVRKEAIVNLNQLNFMSLLQGRTGSQLSSAEDTELTYAFVLMGYTLACSNDLKFYHYLPKERLSLEYLNKLFTAFGTDGPIRNLYYSYISTRRSHKIIRNWFLHLVLSLIRLFKYLIIPPKKFGRKIYFNWSKAYIRQLFQMRPRYRDIKRQINSISGFRDSYQLGGKVTSKTGAI